MIYDNFIILIPALDPPECFLPLIRDLQERGFTRISVTDDGSGEEYQPLFKKAEELGAKVTHHKKRRGKGIAIRTAIKGADKKLGTADFYITADCDGQHTPEDIENIARELMAHPNKLVLGVRKFERTKGKRVSYWINYFQCLFYRVTNHGKNCPDPRSGLRGFPASMKQLALTTEGRSFDYELNFLDAASQVAQISTVPISTETYTVDKTSHFRPVLDLLRMYLKFWRYIFTSNIASVFDMAFFVFFKYLYAGMGNSAIFAATVCARIISGAVGYVLNRRISFRSHSQMGIEMVRYFTLFAGQMAASGILVTMLSYTPIPVVISKIAVDMFLFFVGYNLQKNWVFAGPKGTGNYRYNF